MSNKSSVVPPQHHKDINELIAEKNQKEAQAKQDAELKRQKDLIKTVLLPFLEEFSTSITDSKVLLNNTLKSLNEAFKEKMEEERRRLSETTLTNLDIDERLSRDEANERVRSVLSRVKDEKIGTATSILGALHVAIAGMEMDENNKRKLKDLKIEV